MADEKVRMARGRALLTPAERDAITGGKTKQAEYEAVSRLRARITEELDEDIEILVENRPDVLAELREAVCDE